MFDLVLISAFEKINLMKANCGDAPSAPAQGDRRSPWGASAQILRSSPGLGSASASHCRLPCKCVRAHAHAHTRTTHTHTRTLRDLNRTSIVRNSSRSRPWGDEDLSSPKKLPGKAWDRRMHSLFRPTRKGPSPSPRGRVGAWLGKRHLASPR